MLVLNRNTYDIQEYKFIKTMKPTIREYFILEILQSGHLISANDIEKWIQMQEKILKQENVELISHEKLAVAICRLRKKGIKIKSQAIITKRGRERAYRLEEEMWEN